MATETNKLEIATEVNCDPHKFYEMIKYTLHHLPTVFPDVLKSCKVIEGDGESVGTVRLWEYVQPGSSDVLVCKERIHQVDDENMWIVLDVVEGHLANDYDSILVKIHVIPKGEGSLVKWSIEYGKRSEDVSDPHRYLDLCVLINEKLGGHIASEATELHKLEIATEVDCSPHKFFEMIKYRLHHLPDVLPEVYKSSKVIEGDGESVGSVRLTEYTLPGRSEVLTCKGRIDLIDDENMWIVLSVLEGSLADDYNTFVAKIHVIPKGEGSLVKWSVEYGKCNGVCHPHHYLDMYAMISEKLGAHLVLAN